jgi:tRNA-dihydrouridine synthase B
MEPILYMAPILGVTGCMYRNMYSKLFEGYDLAVMPFINNSIGRRAKHKDVLPERNNVSFGLIPQVLEKSPKEFIVLAKRMYDIGYETMNWNLGCPLPMIRKKKKGSGLLPYPEEIMAFLDEVIPAIPNKLSIKARLGSEDNSDLAALLPMLNDVPIQEIIIHPRTGKQMYNGEADISLFEEILALSRHTIVYNGDIDSVEKYEMLAKRFPTINRWMIGRGGIINPFLPEQIKNREDKEPKEKTDRFLAFHQALLEGYKNELSGQAHIIGKMKEVWWYWVKAFEGGNRLFLELSRTKSLPKYLHTIDKFFEKNKWIK